MVESQGPEHLSPVFHLLADFEQAVLSHLTFPCLSSLVSSEGHGKWQRSCRSQPSPATVDLTQTEELGLSWCWQHLSWFRCPWWAMATELVVQFCHGSTLSIPAPRSHRGKARVLCLKCIYFKTTPLYPLNGFFHEVMASALYSVSRT